MIRSARSDEMNKLREIERAAGVIFRDLLRAIADSEPPPAATLAAYQEAGRAWVCVDEGDEPIAYLLIDLIDAQAHIEQISVHPKVARQGLGAMLIETAASWAQDHKLMSLTLTTIETCRGTARTTNASDSRSSMTSTSAPDSASFAARRSQPAWISGHASSCNAPSNTEPRSQGPDSRTQRGPAWSPPRVARVGFYSSPWKTRSGSIALGVAGPSRARSCVNGSLLRHHIACAHGARVLEREC